MARIFITGSADGLGFLAAQDLIQKGHQVVFHARNEERARQTLTKIPAAEHVLIADLASQEATKKLAANVNALGAFDTVIHNAGVYQASGKDILTVNSLAPYLLTCLIEKPKRLIYLSSGMHFSGHAQLNNLTSGNGINYSDSKLHVLLLAMAVARNWKDVHANTVDPGWVPTKMGGKSAPDNLVKGYETQTWLAVSEDEDAKSSGHYFFHQAKKHYSPSADSVELQDQFLSLCEKLTDVKFPVE